MKWYVADKDYVNYLHVKDNKVEKIDYGDRFKPYFGIVLIFDGFNYYIPVTSPKSKHVGMKNDIDFQKLFDKDGKLVAVLNINNMIPIPSQYIEKLEYGKIELYRTFDNELQKVQYVDLLRSELLIINSLAVKIQRNAALLHKHYKENPHDRLSNRCCNFPLLEEMSLKYK